MRIGSVVRGPIYPTGRARKAGTNQELEGSLGRERGPGSDLQLAREMGELNHANHCAEKSDPCAATVPAAVEAIHHEANPLATVLVWRSPSFGNLFATFRHSGCNRGCQLGSPTSVGHHPIDLGVIQ